MAQLVKNPPAMQETPVQFLGWEDRLPITVFMGFSGGSDGKKSACNAGDLGSVPGLGRSPGEGIGYPLQYLWTSLVAQMVKNLPAMKETWIQSLGWEDPMEEGMPSHPLFLPGESPWIEEPGGLQSTGSQRVGHD